jgi:hypothetical protein
MSVCQGRLYMCYGTLFYAVGEEMVRYSGLTLKAALLVQ